MKLPYISEKIPGIGGKIKERPENFVVEEIPVYSPCDSGEHLFVNITKKGITSRDVQVKMARLFEVNNSDVGLAGMKDKDALTTQTYSLLIGKADKKEIANKLEKEIGVKVNWVKAHKNKLRVGHLLGNKFRIVVSGLEDVDEAFGRAEKIKKVLVEKGLANFYGEQRFGIEAGNISKGLDVIKGRSDMKNPWLKRFVISGYQSYLCNLYLAERMKRGYFEKMMLGDVAKKYDTGGMFVVENLGEEQKRYENKEISFTAPIYGFKMWEAVDDSGKFEKKVIENSGISIEELKKIKIKGTRRTGRIFVKDLEIEKGSDKGELVLNFSLTKGAYATIVLREFMKNELM